MWFHYISFLFFLSILLWFTYETIRKLFFSPDQETIDTETRNLKEKIGELENYRKYLKNLEQEVEVTRELVKIEEKIKIEKKLLSEIENS